MVKKISLIYESERFFDVCNENHSRSYWDIFVVTVIVPIIATVVVVALAILNIGC